MTEITWQRAREWLTVDGNMSRQLEGRKVKHVHYLWYVHLGSWHTDRQALVLVASFHDNLAKMVPGCQTKMVPDCQTIHHAPPGHDGDSVVTNRLLWHAMNVTVTSSSTTFSTGWMPFLSLNQQRLTTQHIFCLQCSSKRCDFPSD